MPQSSFNAEVLGGYGMSADVEINLLDNRWDASVASGMSESELLLYRSNVLGSDKRVTNYGGGK